MSLLERLGGPRNGFVQRKAVWLTRPLGLDKVRHQAEILEAETKRFYVRAAQRSTHVRPGDVNCEPSHVLSDGYAGAGDSFHGWQPLCVATGTCCA